MMNFIKLHWFGISVSIIFLLIVAVLSVVLISPHKEGDTRGFSPCADAMVEDVNECNKKNICVLKSLIRNNICNIDVIGTGIGLWIKGEQSAPWSNYLFEDVKEEDPEELQKFYEKYPDTKEQMIELNKLNEKLEKKYEEDKPVSSMGSE